MGEEMEANICYLGIELNDSYAMVSYMQPNMEEPETVSTIAGSENYRIPTLLARRKNVGMWYYGEDAGRMAKTSEVICVDSLLRRAAASEVITIAKESYYNEKGQLDSYWEYEYEYDKNGFHTKTNINIYEADGTLSKYGVIQYDDNGDYVDTIWYNPDGTKQE